jgi:hypothetical protein
MVAEKEDWSSVSAIVRCRTCTYYDFTDRDRYPDSIDNETHLSILL